MNYLDQEKRLRIFQKADWKCGAKGCNHDIRDFGTPQLAHIIPQKKRYLKKYGKKVIHHELNMIPVCSLKCGASIDINGKDRLIELLIKKIKNKIKLEKDC